MLLRQSLRYSESGPLTTIGDDVDLGSYRNVVHNCDTKSEMTLGFELDDSVRQDFVLPFKPSGRSDTVKQYRHFEFTFVESDGGVYVQRCKLAGDEHHSLSGSRDKRSGFALDVGEKLRKYLGVYFFGYLPQLFPATEEPPRNQKIFDEALSLVIESDRQRGALVNLLQRIDFLEPVRGDFPRYFTVGSSAGSGPKWTSHRILERLHSDDELLADTASIVNGKLGLLGGLRFKHFGKDSGVAELMAKPTGGRAKFNIVDMGSGIAQSLAVVAKGLGTRKGGCYLVEQPELHLHPSLQAHMADALLAIALTGRQVLVETHSEHIVTRLRTLVAEKAVKASEIGMLGFESVRGETRCQQYEVSPNGALDKWPAGFYDIRYNEAKRLSDASSRKRRRGKQK